jgi:hypothetical protein
MTLFIQPMSELSNRARRALVEELGVVDAIRFLNQFRPGHGDYTVERQKLFEGESAGSIAAGIRALRDQRT